ncbi:MAG TPA: hypothetical protein VI873_00280 [Candidatus Peribacteraceae bacterium]|nr:hypothetical protein [Candidatus Peribacteraceae bacterium]
MKHAAVDLHNQLVALGLQPTELSATHFVVKVDPARKQDHWALINNMQKLIDQRILPIVIAVRTVGGEVMRPIHPDAPPMMAKLEDLQQLPIEERKVQMGIN